MRKYIDLINVKIKYTGLFRKFIISIFILSYSGLVLLNYLLIQEVSSSQTSIKLLYLSCLFISPVFTILAHFLIGVVSSIFETEIAINIFLSHLEDGRYSLNYLSLAIVFITGYYTWLRTSYGLAALLLAAFFSFFFWL